MCECWSWLREDIEIFYGMDAWAEEAMRLVEDYKLAGGGEASLPPHQVNQLLEAAYQGTGEVERFLEKQATRPKFRKAWTVKPEGQGKNLQERLLDNIREIYGQFGDRGVRLYLGDLAAYYHARRQEGGVPQGFCLKNPQG
jgi:hypothetical protein